MKNEITKGIRISNRLLYVFYDLNYLEEVNHIYGVVPKNTVVSHHYRLRSLCIHNSEDYYQDLTAKRLSSNLLLPYLHHKRQDT